MYNDMLIYGLIVCIAGVVYIGILTISLLAQNRGNQRLNKFASYILRGSIISVIKGYKNLGIFTITAVITISLLINIRTALAFTAGVLFSIGLSYFAAQAVIKANIRTLIMLGSSLKKSIKTAFTGGIVASMSAAVLGLLGTGLAYILFKDFNIVTGFILGVSFSSLFIRIGGGIYNKAAFIGADFAGEKETGIPSSDYRNPAAVSCSIGQSLGGAAGFCIEIFESYCINIIAAILLGNISYNSGEGYLYVLMIAASGIISLIICFIFAGIIIKSSILKAIKNITNICGIFILAVAGLLSYIIFKGDLKPFYAVAVGLTSSMAMGQLGELYISHDYKHVRRIAKQSKTGPEATIISGFTVGMFSTVLPIIFIAVTIILAFYITGGTENISEIMKGLYGIAISAVGMLSMSVITTAVEAGMMITDSEAGTAQASGASISAIDISNEDNSIGNTNMAIGKGFVIVSTVLTAIALFSYYSHVSGLQEVDFLKPMVLIGLLLGGMLTKLFIAFIMEAVSKSANEIIREIRRQFRETPDIIDGRAEPDYIKCVDILSKVVLKNMAAPAVLAAAVPLIVGLILGPAAVGGLIAGVLVTGLLETLQMGNAGLAWDNAKKYIETGRYGGIGSQTHTASIIGDAVGISFKDTAGTVMNILIKLIIIICIVFAPVFLKYGGLVLKILK